MDLYCGTDRHRGGEGYTLCTGDIARCLRTPINLSFTDPEACAEANSTAVFHPMAGPGDEVLPCIELAGILVVAYLDADMRAVRVCVWGGYPRPAIRRCVRGGRPAARPVRSGAAGSGVIDTAVSFHAAGVVRTRSQGVPQVRQALLVGGEGCGDVVSCAQQRRR
ncbi:hypothetical protein AB0J81_30005 [Streptomyces bobili]|uniref:hypothetical protein n=1 Tax=Streptomyces bobili TaxID=67280 RepID=UPI00342E39C1